jgi:hypothetical protein
VLDKRIPLSTLDLLLQSLIPCTALDLIEIVPDAFVPALILFDLDSRMLSIPRVQFSNELWYQMRVLACFLDGRQARTGCLPLPRSRLRRDISICAIIALCSMKLTPRLLLQQPQIEIPQRVRTQPFRVIAARPSDLLIILQQVRDLGEDGRGHAIVGQILEQ